MEDNELIQKIYTMVLGDIAYFKELAEQYVPESTTTSDFGFYSARDHALADLATAAYARKIKRFIDQHSKVPK